MAMLHDTGDEAPRSRSRGWAWLGLVVLFLGLVAGLGLLYGLVLSSRPGSVFQSDLLQPFLVAHDVLSDPSTIFTWYHSAALYLVPDLLLAGVTALLPIPLLYEPLVYCAVLLALYCFATGWLLRAAGVTSIAGGAIAFSLVIAGLYAALGAFIRAGGSIDVGGDMLIFLGAPFIHTGATLLGVAFAAAILSLRFTPGGGRLAVAIAIAVAGGYSDLIFVLWFVAPVLASQLVMRGTRPLRLTHALVVLAAAVLAAMADRYLRPTGLTVPSDASVAIKVWGDALLRAISEGRWVFPVVVALTGVMTVRGLVLVATARRSPSRWQLAEASLCFAQVAALALPVVSGALEVIENLRYSLAAFFLPLVWLTGTALALSARRPPWLFPGGALVGWLGLSLLLPSAVRAASIATAPNTLSTCLLDSGLTTGMGDYWSTKLTILQTGYRVDIVQLRTDGEAYRYNINDRWFTERPMTREPIAPDFIVMTRLDPEALRLRYGTPAQTVHCGSEEVWLYDHDLLPAMTAP